MSTTTASNAKPHANGAANGGNLIETYAAKLGMGGQALFTTMVETIFPKGRNAPAATMEHVQALILVAEAYDLNPMTKEIYAFPQKGGNGIVPIVSVDGWYKLVSRHPNSNGFQVEVAFDEDGRTPVSATCRMYRKDWDNPVEITEYVSECQRDTDPWNKQPVRMIRHRAIVQAARATFGFGGIYEPDEGARIASFAPEEHREPRNAEYEVADEMNEAVEERKREAARKAAVHKDAQAQGETAQEPKPEEKAPEFAPPEAVTKLVAAFEALDVKPEDLEAKYGPLDQLTPETFKAAREWGAELKKGQDERPASPIEEHEQQRAEQEAAANGGMFPEGDGEPSGYGEGA